MTIKGRGLMYTGANPHFTLALLAVIIAGFWKIVKQGILFRLDGLLVELVVLGNTLIFS